MELPITRSSEAFLQLSSDQVTLSDGAKGRHKIGGQFHEDRMKELQKVKHALIEMAHEEGTDRAVPAGKSMSFYMSTVIEMINATMRSSLAEQHDADKSVMGLHFKQFDTCLSALSSGLAWPNAILVGGSYAGQAYSGLDIDKKAHNDCRQTQNDKKLLYDTCIDDERMRWEAVKAACDDNFTKFYSTVSAKSTGAWQKQCDSQLEIFSNTAPDADPSGLVDLGDVDTEGYLLAQFNFWDKKLEAYLTAEALCKKATATAEAEKADCSSKLEDFFNISKQCDTLQDSLDGMACQQALARHTKCSDYDTCFTTAESSWKTIKQTMCGASGKEGVLQEELIMIEQIECILDAVTKPNSTTQVAKCLNNPPKRSHALLFPQCSEVVPSKNDIQNCGNHLKPGADADMPGTKPYARVQVRHTGLRLHAPTVFSGPCLSTQVEKYYTGPESSPTGYPLPAVSEYEDSNHAPPVDVKARRGPLGRGVGACFPCASAARRRPVWQHAARSHLRDAQPRRDFGHCGTLWFGCFLWAGSC
ncbi:PNC1 [Symbiodinium sp. KB8]|nr:PNC1 [Symbiodinium sp. KB8]